MSIKKRILLNSLIGLALAVFMIAFIIIRMLSIQSANEDYLEVLLKVQSLQAKLEADSQSLDTFAYNMSDANKNQSVKDLEDTNQLFVELKPLLSGQPAKILETAEEKFTQLQDQSLKGLEEKNTAEVKRQSLRTQGIINDLHLLDLYTSNHYDYLQESMKSKIGSVITFALIGSIILIIVTAAVVLRMASLITNPLKQMAHNAQQISEGNLLVDPVDYKPADELGMLNQSFSKMVDQLTSLLSSVDTSSRKVTQFAEELDSASSTLTETSNQVAISTDELSRGTQSVSEDLQSSVELIENMDQEFGNNVDRVQKTVSHVQDTNEAIKEGRNAINRQKQFITESKEANGAIEKATNEFSGYALEIENMAKTVSEIANQTNLLALNAAIEAARAGEAGKGFAVVADEVRKLAEHSGEATIQIFEMVKLIKNSLASILSSVSAGVSLTEKQSENMNETLETFGQIEGKVKGISETLHGLVTGVDMAKNANEQVLHNVESISAVVEETAAGTEEISASANEQLHSISQIVDKANSLKELTDNLNEAVSQFQLKK
nr:methyl-accepting chemotaxis protein [Bacillus massiliglaciei]